MDVSAIALVSFSAFSKDSWKDIIRSSGDCATDEIKFSLFVKSKNKSEVSGSQIDKLMACSVTISSSTLMQIVSEYSHPKSSWTS